MMESRIEEFPLDQSEIVIEALLLTGETLSKAESSRTLLSAEVQIYRLLLFFLRRHKDPALRGELLLRAFEQVKGVVILEHVLVSESASREKLDPFDLEDAGFTALKQVFVEALLARADEDPEAFLAHWNFVSFAYRLNNFGDGAGKKWLIQHVTTTERFLLLACSLVQKSLSHSKGISSKNYYIPISTINDLFEVELCRKWLVDVDRIELNVLEKQAIELIHDTIEKFERGEKSDYY